MKYPEFREMYKKATWYGGWLCKLDGVYYKLVKIGEKKREVMSYNYDELSDKEKALVEQITKENEAACARLAEFFYNLAPAKKRLIDYVQKNGILKGRSNVSESEYWVVKGIDGIPYTVRISGHRYPTGSMTNLNLNIIDTTDDDCRQYCKIFGI